MLRSSFMPLLKRFAWFDSLTPSGKSERSLNDELNQKEPFADFLENRYFKNFLQISQENTCVGVSF